MRFARYLGVFDTFDAHIMCPVIACARQKGCPRAEKKGQRARGSPNNSLLILLVSTTYGSLSANLTCMVDTENEHITMNKKRDRQT